jgi:hypothetical protein
MRRTRIAFFAVLLLIVFAGCSRAEVKAEEIDFHFQCDVNIVSGEQKINCCLNRTSPGIVSLKIASGDLNGMTYDWSGEDFSITYCGLTAKSESCVLPTYSFAEVLKQTLDCAEKSGSLTKTHGNEFSGNLNGFDFTLTTDGDGRIQKITVPGRNFSAEFYNYTEQGL